MKVNMVSIDDFPSGANNISNHVLYEIKSNNDDTLNMKAGIAPHGNNDSERKKLKTGSATSPPIGIRIILLLAVKFKWKISKIYFQSAFLHSGETQRGVDVITPVDSND